ncbi:hypothetical protein [Chitinophaga nivalis]|uniref:Uncharacterized protein n=1 Tax=Chitinophaga nivalis TaxID=2991709 RepID=A0ABT3IH87_9BACT|nr:hypothetical protein [Chitinophaga nivalis]MCW3466995.1 hypothetical protein [Chitinophaga nivalis]MCW3483314.1 hypothetical protein [Chitinophaga nivalis]
MKANIYLILFLLTGIVLTSCKKDKIAYQNDFNKSFDAWINFKASAGNAYRYGIQSSSWTGHSSVTTITVKGGKIVQRSYIAKGIHPTTKEIVILAEWKEEGSQLGTHDAGYPLRTLDEIYQEAKDNWLQKRDNADTYFEAKNNGMISSCGYVENNCADDCFMGISISFIEKI